MCDNKVFGLRRLAQGRYASHSSEKKGSRRSALPTCARDTCGYSVRVVLRWPRETLVAQLVSWGLRDLTSERFAPLRLFITAHPLPSWLNPSGFRPPPPPTNTHTDTHAHPPPLPLSSHITIEGGVLGRGWIPPHSVTHKTHERGPPGPLT